MVDALVWTRGTHTFKAGVDYRRPLVRSYNDQFSRGRLSFNKLADLLAGVAAPSGTSIARGATRRDTYTNNVGTFVQDDWKVTRRLTLNLGLRYEYSGPFSEKSDRISNFIPSQGLVQVGQGLDTLYDRDWNNFAPRVGFAFDPRGTGKTVLRGGYGFYYDAPSQDFFLAQSFPNGNVGTNPVPGLGTFTVNFTGPVPFGPGVDIFGDAQHARPAVHGVRRGPAHAHAVRAELQLQRAADHRRWHRAAGRLRGLERHEAVPRARHQSGRRRALWAPSSSAGRSTPLTRSSPASTIWKPRPTPTTTRCKRFCAGASPRT